MAKTTFTKGNIGGRGLVLFWSALVLVLVILVFSFLFKGAKPETIKIDGIIGAAGTQTNILNLLRTPTSQNGHTVAEAIIAAYETSTTQEEMTTKLKPIMEPLLGQYRNIKWRVLISNPSSPQQPFIIADETGTGTTEQPIIVNTIDRSCVQLPSMTSGIITVDLLILNDGLPPTNDARVAYQNSFRTFLC